MSDPKTVTWAQARAAYDALGLDPEKWDDRLTDLTIEMNPTEIRVIRRHLTFGPPKTEITEYVAIPYGPERP